MERRATNNDLLKKWRAGAAKTARTAKFGVGRRGPGLIFDVSEIAASAGRRPPRIRVTGPAKVMTVGEALGDGRLRKEIVVLWSDEALAGRDEARLEAGVAGGLVIVLPPGGETTVVIEEDLDRAARVGRLIVIALPDSRGTVVERVFGRRSGRSASSFRAFVGRGARLAHFSLRDLPPSVIDLVWRRAVVAEDGRMEWSEGCFGGDLAAASVVTDLAGRGAGVRQRTIFVGGGKGRFSFASVVRHRASQTSSDLDGRGVLLGSARAAWRGLVRIPPGLQGCQGSEKSDILLFSPGAEASSQPEFEVDSDDVRCRHASAIGRLDREKLFYLMSRGLDRKQAARRMAEGFLSPVLGALSGVGSEEVTRSLIGHKFSELI